MDDIPYDLIKFYQTINYEIVEGSIDVVQARYISRFLKEHPEIKLIAETGFNGGLSSACFLGTRPDIRVVSFDIGDHPCVVPAKRHIDTCFPGRHTLILGDSTQSIPALKKSIGFQGIFDMVFIDGGHTSPVPAEDLKNFCEYLSDQGWILMDDYTTTHPGAVDVIDAWNAAEKANLVKRVDIGEGSGYRAWVLGHKI